MHNSEKGNGTSKQFAVESRSTINLGINYIYFEITDTRHHMKNYIPLKKFYLIHKITGFYACSPATQQLGLVLSLSNDSWLENSSLLGFFDDSDDSNHFEKDSSLRTQVFIHNIKQLI